MVVEKIIFDALRKGEENGLSLSTVKQLTGLTDREARRTIESMRRNGALICSSTKGYYFADTTDELRNYVQTVQKRTDSELATLKPFVDRLEAIDQVHD